MSTGKVVVAPQAVRQISDAERRTSDVVESALSARRQRLVSMHEARDRMMVFSRPPVSANTTDIDVLANEARNALEHVAFGRASAAQKSVKEVLARAERALESLNRETKTARHVLDACLALVRSALSRDHRRDALAEAMRCRRLVPDVSPSELLHPASVIGVVAEADDQLRRMRTGRLVVESLPEPGCAAYVNGRHLGVTPFKLDRAAAGEYRVQVECSSERGLVHIVQLGDEPVSLTVDTEFDRALRTDERVAFVYDTPNDRDRLAAGHGAALAKLMEADEAVLVTVDGPTARLTRVSSASGRVLGRTSLPWLKIDGAQDPVLESALNDLMEGRDDGTGAGTSDSVAKADVGAGAAAVGGSAAAPAVVSASQRPGVDSPREPMSRTRRMRLASGGLLVAGAALLATGVAFEMQRASTDDEIAAIDSTAPETARALAEKQDTYDKASSLRWLGLPGGLLMAGAVPLLRVDVSKGVPWWSYAVGGAGVGLAAWGGFELSRNGACNIEFEDGSCARERASGGRAGLLFAGALPLLTVPVTHLLTWALGDRQVQVQAEVASSGPGTRVMVGLKREIGAW